MFIVIVFELKKKKERKIVINFNGPESFLINFERNKINSSKTEVKIFILSIDRIVHISKYI